MTAPVESRGYANSDVLVSTDWVAAHLNDASVRIVESNEDLLLYPSGHIPGAVQVDWTLDLNDQVRRDYLAREAFERPGVAHRHHARDDGRLLRRQEQLVGVLRVLGLPAVRPHGGQDHGRRPPEVGEGRPPDDARRAVVSADDATRRASARTAPHRAFRDEVLAHIRAKGQLVDVRSPQEYSGERLHMPDYPNEGALRGGHIPGAKSVPWARAINAEDGTFKTAAELREIYVNEQALKPSEPTIAYCRIGERSSHTWFVLKYLLGFANVRNYDGSWTEWGNLVGVPIEK